MAEGQTATNPQTGERVVLRGGQWVPLGSGQALPRQQRQTAPRRPISFQSDADAVARTLIGEAANQGEQGMLAVGGVIANRARQRGLTPAQVVLERNQFEPWGNPDTTNRLLSISPQSPEYQQAYAIAQRALAGEDPTGGASHFYAPRAQAALGRAKPSWDNGTGRAIGDHLFFNLDGSPAQTPDASFTSAPMPAEQPTIQTATNPQTGEKLQLIDGQWVPMQQAPIEVVVDEGVQNVNGRAILAGQDMGPWEDYWANQRRSQADRQARVERQANPEYQAALADARRGSANVPDQLRAFTQGTTLGFLDEILGGVNYAYQGLENAGNRVAGRENRYSAAMAAQAARDSERDAQARFAAENPIQNFGLQVAGGLFTPGIGQAGRFIESAQGAARLGRAAGVGAGVGVASGIGYGEGNLIERAPGAVTSGLVGAGTGVIGQRALDAVSSRIAGQGGGAARRLSRAGVDLTPGQMVAETPVVGQFIRNLEDVAGGFNPLMAGVRNRQNQQVVRAAGNEALAPIGETLPKDARTGYQVAQRVSKVLGDRYDQVTSGISARVDPQFTQDFSGLMARAGTVLDDSNLGRLERILRDKVYGEIDGNGTLSGDNFKRIETALRQQSERASRPTSTLADNDLAEMIDESRDVVRDLIARQYPAAADEIQNLNRGWANYKRIERAVTGSAGFSREGTPTPGELSQTVANMSSNSQIANERALLQGLATDARTILPSTVPDSGTAQKTVLAASAGALGTGAVAAINPTLATLIATGAVVYSRPGISFLNALYRATDSRAANEIVRQLAQQAQENPALIPYYEAAASYLVGRAPTDTPTAPQAQPSAQAPSAALQRVMQ